MRHVEPAVVTGASIGPRPARLALGSPGCRHPDNFACVLSNEPMSPIIGA